MTRRTRSRVAGETISGRLSTFETVPTDTLARCATCCIVTFTLLSAVDTLVGSWERFSQPS
jgi:hypothetical protein